MDALSLRRRAILGLSDVSGDLSMVDIYGRRWAGGRRTANCYVVSRPGDYRIPLIYGSAVKNGVTNAAAYTNGGGTYQAAFVNYKGQQITAPNIETDTLTSAASAELSLADENNIFTDVSLATIGGEKFLCFKVSSVPAVGANGILAIKDSNGDIMWSWHIWVWGDSLATVRLTNHTGYNYDILPVNLASKWDDSSKAHIKNWYYQWGRKDPMCPPASYNSSSDYVLFGSKTFTIASAVSSLCDSIKSPHIFYKQYNDTTYNWNRLSYVYNFWDASRNNTGAQDNLSTAVKTIYDPCPSGFMVSIGNTFTGFTTTGTQATDTAQFNIIGSFDSGWKFKANDSDASGVFFPASGNRASNTGLLDAVGVSGHLRIAANHNQRYVYRLHLDASTIHPLSGDIKASALSIRPIREYDYMGV